MGSLDHLNFRGGGEIAARLFAYRWDETPLGPLQSWSATLVGAVNLVMNCPLPAALYWGAQMTLIYNEGYGEAIGDRHPAAFGSTAAQVWNDVWPIYRPQFEAVLLDGDGFMQERVPFRVLVGDQFVETFWTYSLTPVYEEGRVGGIFKTNQNVTEQGFAGQEVAAATGQCIGMWDWDLETDRVMVDEGMARFWGGDIDRPGEWLASVEFMRPIHPDDVAGVYEAGMHAVQTGEEYNHQYRVVQPDGTTRWVMVKGRALYNVKGEPIRFPGLAFDITEQVERGASPETITLAKAARPMVDVSGLLRFSAAHEVQIQVPVGVTGASSGSPVVAAAVKAGRKRSAISLPRLVEAIVKSAVESKEEVRIATQGDCDGTEICLRVGPLDLEKLSGEGDRTLRSIRAILAAASVKEDHRYSLAVDGATARPDAGVRRWVPPAQRLQ